MLGVSLEHIKCPLVWCCKTAFGLPTHKSVTTWLTKHSAQFAVSTVLRPQNSHRWWQWSHSVVPTVYWVPHTRVCTHPTSSLWPVSQPKVHITVLNICVNRTARVAWWSSVQTVYWPRQSERCWEARTCGFNGSDYCGRLAVAITGGR
jgi:hypothetical protein